MHFRMQFRLERTKNIHAVDIWLLNGTSNTSRSYFQVNLVDGNSTACDMVCITTSKSGCWLCLLSYSLFCFLAALSMGSRCCEIIFMPQIYITAEWFTWYARLWTSSDAQTIYISVELTSSLEVKCADQEKLTAAKCKATNSCYPCVHSFSLHSSLDLYRSYEHLRVNIVAIQLEFTVKTDWLF